MTDPTQNISQTEDVEDPLERMLKKTGCMELHYQVQDCIAETQDWRKCQDQLQKFKICMNKYQESQQANRK